jgi:NADH:ubiquinone oxidoreductase subunit 3 (subunit A)
MTAFSVDAIAVTGLVSLIVFVSVIKLYIKFEWFRQFMDWLLTKR